MLKVFTVVGTRPEIIRLSRIIPKLDQFFEHSLIHTGQNFDYELNEIFFNDLGIRKPDFFLNSAGTSSSDSIANVIKSTDKLLKKYKPDIFFVLGDTNSAFSAIAAKKNKVPILHMEAGNRCFDQRVPEEVNRKIIDHISDLNITYSDIAREHLLRENIRADNIVKVGSPLTEVIDFYYSKIQKSLILETLNLKKHGFILLSSHREENIESNKMFTNLCNIINNLHQDYSLPIIVSTHPRTRKKIESTKTIFDGDIRLLKPLSFTDYVKLQISASVVISDSGSLSEESSILNFPAINIRETQERHEAIEETSVMFTGMNYESIKIAMTILGTQKRGKNRNINPVSDYQSKNVSEKIPRLILSYKDYIDQNVWKKQIL